MSYDIWKKTRNPKTFLASSEDFLADEKISQTCKDSYIEYTETTDGNELPKNKAGYPQTNWSYIDNIQGVSYTATFNEKYGWGVMRNPADRKQEDTKTQTVTATPATPTKGQSTIDASQLAKSSPKLESSLGTIAEEITIIRKLIEILAEKKADELIKPASEIK